MDDEDSQDELINKNASHGKGKRPATSIFSDEEGNSEDGEDSQGGETDSEDDEDDASEDGEEDDGEEEEDEVESEHEGAEKDLEGAVGSTSADFAGLSSDEDAEKCPICLNSFHEQPVATPESCEHYFCLDCILEWAKNANSCPVDRIVFSNIFLRKCYGGKVQKTITVKKPEKAIQEEQVNVDLEQTNCEVCGGSDREDRLLLCDGCDAGYHMECLTPPLNAVPVEEWFCPECAPNARNERSTEDESNVLPTTSRFQPSNSRPTRAIARTQHSERVRRNVNRHRITQARTAAQLAPRYLMQSTWLDETINAVVAGLNTAVYVRDLTPRPRSRRRRKTVRRRKTKKDGKDVDGKKSSTGVRRRKRRVRRTKSRKKLVVKKTTTRGRIAHNLGMKKPVRSSVIPSVYRPSEQTLGSMRADIGAASLSIYGDPFDLDPFDDQNEEVHQTSTPSSLLEAKRRGLSRSAMRSHQPVARPISSGLTRRGHSIPQIEEVAEATPVPDLLGSILSGQSMLLMDSSDIVINRDGSLKATKPVNTSLPRSISNGSTSGESGITSAGASPSVHQSIRQTPPSSSSSSTPLRGLSSHSPSPPTPLSPPPPLLHTPPPVPGHPRLHTTMPHRPGPSQPAETEHPTRVPSGASDSRRRERGDTSQQIPAKKPPPKPVWVDVSVLPRIPKIKRENSSEAQSSRVSNSNNLPESSMTSLAGDKGRQHTVDQQRASASRHSKTADSHRQRLDRPGPSSSFSNSFSTSSSSSSVTSNARPSSSSAISFRINASGNPWHARRLSAPEQSGEKDKESAKRTQKDKQMLLLSRSQAKKAPVKSEVYDPFDPTGSDSSESETENDCPEMDFQSTACMSITLGQNEGAKLQFKKEPMDFDTPHVEESTGEIIQVKKEPASFKEDPYPKPLHNFASKHRQMPSESLAAVMAYSGSPAMSDTEHSASPESPFTKALDRSRSSSTSSQHSDNKDKIEIKDEPDDEPLPVKSTSEPEVPKGNGLCGEVPSVASSADVSHKSKEKEIASPFSQPEEESLQRESVYQSSPSKNLESSSEENEHSWSEDRRRSSSRSPGCRRSRSRSKEKRHSRSRSKEKMHSPSKSKEKRRSRSRSKEKRHSRSRSKEKRRSRSRSKEKRRSRSRSKEKRRSRSRLKEKRRSRSKEKRRSRSKEKRRSRSRSNEKRRSRSRSKGRRRSRSRSKERRRSLSRSPVRRRSRSKSKERRRSRSGSREKRRSRSRSKEKRRSRSKERKHSRSQDKRRPAGSSSDESSRKKKAKHTSLDLYDGKGKDGNKKSKDTMRSRSRSRSVERRRDQPSSHRSSAVSKDGGDMRSKRRRSRSSSREKRQKVDVSSSERKSKALYQKERSTNKSLVSPSVKAQEPIYSLKKNAVAVKKETESGESQYETGISVLSIKKEKETSSSGCLAVIDKNDEITEETPSVVVSNRPQANKPKEIKLESTCTLGDAEEDQMQKHIKIETGQSNTLFEELKKTDEIKKEKIAVSDVLITSCELNEICISKASTPSNRASHSLHQEGKSTDCNLEPLKQVKIEQIWSEEDDCGEEDNPYSDGALVINLSTPDPTPVDCDKEPRSELTSMPVVAKEELEVVPLQTPCPVKQEPVDSSDEDINVDYLIDNLDFIKKELKEEGSVTDPPGATEPQPLIQDVSAGPKQEIESALVIGGTKAKSQGKRVTWNIQEPEGPPPEKMSKLALFKLKLKQEGSRKAASTTSTQSSCQEAASVQVGLKPAATRLNPLLEEEQSDLSQGCRSVKQDVSQDPDQKDKYIKKLHMQERAVEEVKLAIKPFYQKRDITKEEYKEILRKAVQKVCHSKSGEINPVKVANLVKAYVDKYKHARKHRKAESLGQSQNTEGSKDSETPG